ncbi:MAG: AsmA-like C-terminal domain-containing protein [Desulfobacteraceae bacterium]|nr:AsmA-like C-terminal domain-containing protein [Desulfobacteraceae bacterium]
MKIRTKAALLLLILVAGVALAPLLLRVHQVQTAVVNRLQDELHVRLRTEDLRWHWWPFPRMVVLGLRADAGRWHLAAPEAEYQPAWTVLFGRAGSAGRIVLEKPLLRMATGGQQPAKPVIRLPRLSVSVADGSISMPATALPFPLPSGKLDIAAVNGRIDLHPDEIRVQARAASPFFEKMEVDGGVKPATGAYRFEVKSRGLEIRKVVASLAGGRVVPAGPKMNLRGNVTGVGLATFKADLKGELPCFLVKPSGRSAQITCGFADLSVSKSGPSLALVLNSLDLKEPRLRLQGKVLRTQQGQGEPRWTIDLTARDVDLNALREKTLSVLGDVHLARLITGIVLGGAAPAVRFQFAGPAKDLCHLKNISIEGQLERARLLVPKVGFDLNGVSGEFAIRNGRLTGNNLQAELGKSRGRNGELLLGLTGDEKEFVLDLDLDAELAELPTALHRTVHNEAFLAEVDRFSSLEGRVRGHVHLGDRLKHPLVDVTVGHLQGSGRYARLPWPFKIEGGRLEVRTAGQVHWYGVRATIGPHQVADASGSVSWGSDLRLDVDSFQASFDAAPLFHELIRYPVVRRKLTRALTSASGSLEVTKGSFHGPLRRPDQWEYDLGIKGKDLAWTSPLVGQPVTTRKASGRITHQEAVIADSDNLFGGQRIAVQGRIEHRRLTHWHGWIEVTGTANEQIASWVKERGWVPPAFFPKTPCFLDGLRIGWGKGEWTVHGGIVAGTEPQALPRVDLDVRKTGEDLTVKRLAVRGEGGQGLLAMHLPLDGSGRLELSWQGDLDGRTVDALLESNRLLLGEVTGDWVFRHDPGQPQETIATGRLRATDLRIPLPGLDDPLVIEKLSLNGNGAALDLPLIQVQYAGERAEAKGRISATPGGLLLDLQAASPALSWSNLKRLEQALREAGVGREGTFLSRGLRGRIGFDIAELHYAAPAGPGAEKKASHQLHGLQGTVELQPEGQWVLELQRAGICGLALSGTWSSTEEGVGMVHLRSDPQAPPAFEKVMPCFGLKQDLIVGGFDLDVTLHGRPGHWTDGKARLHSANGNIRRMTLLSKIFSVINLTDLFTAPGPVAGGLPYSTMDLEGRIANNQLIIEKAVVRGQGLNLFGRGSLDLGTYQADLTVLIAPFKTIDAIISRVPLLGRLLTGRNATLLAIPVGVTGSIADPAVTVLSPQAVGESLLSMVKETLSLPFTLLGPIFERGK